jgi:hypothetical protein
LNFGNFSSGVPLYSQITPFGLMKITDAQFSSSQHSSVHYGVENFVK